MTRLAIPCASLLLLVAAACNADNPNYGDDGGIDAPNTTCTGSGPDPACPPDNPICSDRRCGGMCTADTECSGRSDGATVCLLPTGDCVACDESNSQAAPGSAEDECRDPTMPVCDATSHTCRACREHSECASGVCDAGACAPAANVIYMKADGADTGDCLTPAEGCKTLQYSIGKLTATRKFILLAPSPGSFYLARDGGERADFNNKVAYVVGYGASLRRADDGPVVEVRGASSDVILEGLAIERGAGASGTGVINSSRLEVRRAIVRNNDRYGIDSNGNLRVVRSTVTGNRQGGLVVTGGGYTVVNNIIFNNGDNTAVIGGVSLATSTTGNVFEFNTVAANSTNSATFADGVQCTGSLTARNSIIVGGAGRPRVSPATTCTFTYSLFGPDNMVTGTGNVLVDNLNALLFTSATDLHVQSGTVATGKAQTSNLGADASKDFDGDSRQPDGTMVEVGADEIP